MLKIIDAKMRDGELDGKAIYGRVYFFVKGENILENLQKRRSRPYTEYRKVLPEVFEKVGFDARTSDELASSAKWSQKAGCGCGCSPGFIVKALTSGEQVFVDVRM